MSSIPPASNSTEREAARKRPWYLVVALILVSLAGITAAADGCKMIGYYRGAVRYEAPYTDGIAATDQEAIREAFDRYTRTLDEEKKAMFPLAAAAVVLGMAMFAFSAAAMSGREGARRALTQLVAVRVGLLVLAFFATKRVRAADQDLAHAWTIAVVRAADPENVARMGSLDRYRNAITTGFVVIEVATLGLVILALTRRRTRDFFEAAEAFADD